MRLTLHHDAKGTKSFNTKEIENIFLIKLLRTMKKKSLWSPDFGKFTSHRGYGNFLFRLR